MCQRTQRSNFPRRRIRSQDSSAHHPSQSISFVQEHRIPNCSTANMMTILAAHLSRRYMPMFSIILITLLLSASAFVSRQPSQLVPSRPIQQRPHDPSPLLAILSGEGRKNYDPKWKKKQTLAEQGPPLDLEAKGIKGTIHVRFQQGNATKLYLARPGQPLRDVALQAGQFIKYGCGKGECGTCEAL